MRKVTPELLKAAQLFVLPARREARFMTDLYKDLTRVHLVREKGSNIVWASDRHTMFIARDRKGVGFDRYGKNPPWPMWKELVARIPEERSATSGVWANPKYIQRVMQAAKILGLDSVPTCLGPASDVMIFPLGPDACAFVMPMRQEESKGVPSWLAAHSAPPKLVDKGKRPKRSKASAKRKKHL